MPELPEVETTRLGLKPLLKKTIQEMVVRDHRLRWPIDVNIKNIIKNKVIHDVRRRAKYLVFVLDEGFLLIHLGMSGRLSIVSKKENIKKHDHVDFIFQDSELLLRFNDPRRFGSIHYEEKEIEQHFLIKHLGLEPLEKEFNSDYLFKKSRKKTQCIKNTIMDSRVVVGVGNIYASESLFLAAIKPTRRSGSMTKYECERLVAAIKKIIGDAIKMGGSSINDYASADGSLGYFQQEHKVYGKAGFPCSQCGQLIVKKVLGQRSSFFCKQCQK